MERVRGKVKELIHATEIEGCGLVTILIRWQVQKRNVKTNVLVPRLRCFYHLTIQLLTYKR